MGYSHYWSFKDNAAPSDIKGGKEKFGKAVGLIKRAKERTDSMGVKVDSAISEKEVWINGVKGEDCEDFVISPKVGMWDFCKTGRKPYDILVCIALLAFKESFGDDFNFTSDGISSADGFNDGWCKAIEVFNGVMKEG